MEEPSPCCLSLRPANGGGAPKPYSCLVRRPCPQVASAFLDVFSHQETYDSKVLCGKCLPLEDAATVRERVRDRKHK